MLTNTIEQKATTEIEFLVQQFKPITLGEMDSVKLLNRTDAKYILPFNKLENILAQAADEYFMLYVNDTPFQDYQTTYFDTVKNAMYLAHQNGRLNRYKIRHRTYLSTQTEFLEIKFKTNRGRTIKKRIQHPFSEPLENANSFIKNYSPFLANELLPKTRIDYTRLTLVNLKNGERVTIDLNLKAINCESLQEKNFHHICIVELKREKGVSSSPMIEILRQNRVFPKGMSKYCIGTAATYEEIKSNRFKKKIRYINLLNNY